jgi:polyvinyl alcohol dehydrogenase (cytochrome)
LIHGRRNWVRHGGILLVGLAVLALPAVANSSEWPIYGHDLANSRDGGSAGPAPSQVPSMKHAWTFRSSTGDFTGTPVVADGVLVAGNNGGFVYALDARTGKVLWSKDVGQPINGTAAIDTDAPGGAVVYVPIAELDGPRLLALSLSSGETRWDTVLTDQPDADVFGSPTFWRGTVYMGTSGPNNDDSRARGSVVAVDEATGQIRWQTFTVPPDRDGAAVWSTPAIDTATGRLYVGTGNNYHPPTTDTEDSIMALDAQSGQILGHFQATSGDSFALDNPLGILGGDFDFGASPNLFTGPSGAQLVGEGQKSGIYWAVDRATMQPVWSKRVGPGGFLGGILGSTASDGHRIFGADTLSGQVFALAGDGTLAWRRLETGAVHVGATTIAHGVLYTVDPVLGLVARNAATGAVLARRFLGAPSFGGVSAAGGAIYVAVGTGPLPAPLPQFDLPGSIVAFGDTSP